MSRDYHKLQIAVYGGSFNPPTLTHLEVGRRVRDELGVDAVWYLVSHQNPHKSSDDMAPFSHRLKMVELMLKDELRLHPVGVEAEFAEAAQASTLKTAYVLEQLRKRHIGIQLLWVVGADGFAAMHTWGDHEKILSNHTIVVLPRKGSTEAALTSPCAQLTRRLEEPGQCRTQRGWYFMGGLENDVNATACRAALKSGERPATMMARVADYALNQKLYVERSSRILTL